MSPEEEIELVMALAAMFAWTARRPRTHKLHVRPRGGRMSAYHHQNGDSHTCQYCAWEDERGGRMSEVEGLRAEIERLQPQQAALLRHAASWPAEVTPRAERRAEASPNIGETCCGQCPGATCYVDGITGERAEGGAR